MTLPEIAYYRLISQQLTATSHSTATEMVAYFGAVQGQEYGPSKWGLGLRLPHLDDTLIEAEFTKGQILRTHLLRPTWHFVAAEDIRWLLMLTAPRVNAINQFTYRKMELAGADFIRCNNIISKALEGGKQLTRDELNSELKKHKIEASGVRLVSIMMQAELDGLICSGARQGKQFTYALLEERVPKTKTKTREEALAELAKRYFTSRGPATVKDFSVWSGLHMTDCRTALELVKPQFENTFVANETYYFDGTIVSKKSNPENLYLLPIYDEMIMGYKNRDALLQYMFKTDGKIDVVFDNMIIFDGQIIGSWKRTIKPKQIEITYNFLEKPTKKQWAAFEKCLIRFGEFNNLPVTQPIKPNL